MSVLDRVPWEGPFNISFYDLTHDAACTIKEAGRSPSTISFFIKRGFGTFKLAEVIDLTQDDDDLVNLIDLTDDSVKNCASCKTSILEGYVKCCGIVSKLLGMKGPRLTDQGHMS